MNPKALSRLALLCLLALAAACGSSAYHRGMYYIEKHQWDLAADNLQQAVDENPHDLRYQEAMVRTKLKASQTHMDLAQMALGRQDYPTALKHLERALHYDPSNQYAKDQLQKVVTLATAKELSERQRATSIDEMKADARDDMGVPRLDPASNIPIVLKFTDTSAKTILDAISKASGVNFLYDDKADVTKRLTVDFAKVNLSQVLDYLMMQTKSFYKVLDPHTLIIVPDNKQKRDEYTDQVIRTFYLSNADAKDVFQLVRSILQARKMAMNQDLNSITIQDSPEIVAICQKIIEANDKSKGEVAVDVELLEVDSGLTRQLGIDLSNHQFTIGPKQNITYDSSGNPSGIGTGPPVPLNKFVDVLTHSLYIYPVPNFIADLLLDTTGGQILARPQLRVMEGQKAMVHIGDKYPIPTANLYNNTAGTVGQAYQPVTSYTYQDIGVKIEIEPKVHHNHEITIKLKVEISAISGSVGGGSPNNPSQPIIGTRESNSVIRLEDGETSMMAGLISQEERVHTSGLPGISEIPILRRLFSTTKDEKKKTDVVMLLTPHIIRMPNIAETDIKPVWVGTADNPKLKGENLNWAPSPFGAGAADKAKAAPPASQPSAQPAGQPPAQPAGQPAPVKTPPPAVPPQTKPTPVPPPVSTVTPAPAAPAASGRCAGDAAARPARSRGRGARRYGRLTRAWSHGGHHARADREGERGRIRSCHHSSSAVGSRGRRPCNGRKRAEGGFLRPDTGKRRAGGRCHRANPGSRARRGGPPCHPANHPANRPAVNSSGRGRCRAAAPRGGGRARQCDHRPGSPEPEHPNGGPGTARHPEPRPGRGPGLQGLQGSSGLPRRPPEVPGGGGGDLLQDGRGQDHLLVERDIPRAPQHRDEQGRRRLLRIGAGPPRQVHRRQTGRGQHRLLERLRHPHLGPERGPLERHGRLPGPGTSTADPAGAGGGSAAHPAGAAGPARPTRPAPDHGREAGCMTRLAAPSAASRCSKWAWRWR